MLNTECQKDRYYVATFSPVTVFAKSPFSKSTTLIVAGLCLMIFNNLKEVSNRPVFDKML